MKIPIELEGTFHYAGTHLRKLTTLTEPHKQDECSGQARNICKFVLTVL